MTKDLKQSRDELHWEMYKVFMAALLTYDDKPDSFSFDMIYDAADEAVFAFIKRGVE